MDDFLAEFKAHLSAPDAYLHPTKKLKSRSTECLRKFFGLYKQFAGKELSAVEKLPSCKRVDTGPLSELYTEGMDSDQIWEQIELVNKSVLKSLGGVMADISTKIESGEFQLAMAQSQSEVGSKLANKKEKKSKFDEEDSEEVASGYSGSEEETEKEEEDDEEEEGGRGTLKATSGKRSIVDDDFFKLSEMEKFLEAAEKKDAKGEKLYVIQMY